VNQKRTRSHQDAQAGRTPALGACDLGHALALILEALEGPAGELGTVSAVSLIREGERAQVTALVRSARTPGRTMVHRGSVGPDWTRAGRLGLKWGPTAEIADASS
jgi:hypothetical protein